ncbi:MAG: Roadblock/LC7 family protein [Promethearchaeota archaeon CR_4]|nr:MAG: Roadblock/LC7 family protein [Candidatus Lokiarchaeota archaeon CR_4]
MSEHLDELTQLLRNLQAQNHEISGCTIVSVQGLPIVTSMSGKLQNTVNEGIISAMTAAILSVGDRAAQELQRGTLKRILIEGEVGTIIISQAGQHAILCVLCRNDAKLGMIFLTMASASKKIAELLD